LPEIYLAGCLPAIEALDRVRVGLRLRSEKVRADLGETHAFDTLGGCRLQSSSISPCAHQAFSPAVVMAQNMLMATYASFNARNFAAGLPFG